MATDDSRTKDSFRFIWRIDNVSRLTLINFKSPSFVIKSVAKTIWHLVFQECRSITFALVPDGIFGTQQTGDVYCEFSLLGADGPKFISDAVLNSPEDVPLRIMTSRDEFLERWDEFVPNNTLTVQCRMWRRDCEIPTDVCFARTVLKAYTGSFLWPIEGFGAFPSIFDEDWIEVENVPDEFSRTYSLELFTKKGPLTPEIKFTLFLQKDSASEYIRVVIEKKNEERAFNCELSILDGNGTVIVSREIVWNALYKMDESPFRPLISKDELITKRICSFGMILYY